MKCKSGMVANTYGLSTWDTEVRGSGAQGHPQRLGEFKASLGYLWPGLQTRQMKNSEMKDQQAA